MATPLQRKIVEFFGLQKSIVGLLLMVILVGMGERMAERFLPIYLMALGGGAMTIGLLGGLTNLISALYSFPGGYLSDHLGHKKALLVFNGIALVGYIIVIIFPYWQAVIIGALFFLAWSAISLPATMSLVADVLPRNKRTMGVTLHSLVRRVPMALGPILGVVAFIIRGLKEFGEPTRKALIMDLALEDKKAGMFGLYYLIRDVIVSIAAFGGAFLWEISPQVNFLIAFACGLAGTLCFSIFGRDLKSQA